MDSRRTEIARENDDSEIIETIEPAPAEGGGSGGALKEDVATKVELERVRDPNAHGGIDKKDKIDHRQESPTRHPADRTP
jgi:hypothetical protein